MIEWLAQSHVVICSLISLLTSWICVQSYLEPWPSRMMLLMRCCSVTSFHACLCHFSPRLCLQLHAPSWAGLVWLTVVSGSHYSSSSSCPLYGLKCGFLASATTSWALSKTIPVPCQRFPAVRVLGRLWACVHFLHVAFDKWHLGHSFHFYMFIWRLTCDSQWPVWSYFERHWAIPLSGDFRNEFVFDDGIWTTQTSWDVCSSKEFSIFWDKIWKCFQTLPPFPQTFKVFLKHVWTRQTCQKTVLSTELNIQICLVKQGSTFFLNVWSSIP